MSKPLKKPRKLKKYTLVSEAIAWAKSTDAGAVSLALEEMLHKEMMTWPSYASSSPKQRQKTLFARLDMLQIRTIGDVRELINAVATQKMA